MTSVDMSDPVNWKVGDLVECTLCRIDLTKGKLYEITITGSEYGCIVIHDDRESNQWRDSEYFRFHSRPVKGLAS